MSDEKKAKAKPAKREVTGYEIIMSKTIENVLSTMQMYTSKLHASILERAMLSLTSKPALRLNLLKITGEEEDKAIRLLSQDPARAHQAALNYGFNFPRHSSSDLGWNLGLSILLVGMLR